MKSNLYFETHDLALAVIISLFFPVNQINKENPRKVIFIFVKNSKLENVITRYWNKELRVEPRQYFDQLKVLKARIYSNE